LKKIFGVILDYSEKFSEQFWVTPNFFLEVIKYFSEKLIFKYIGEYEHILEKVSALESGPGKSAKKAKTEVENLMTQSL